MVTQRTLVERRTLTVPTFNVDREVKVAFAHGWQVASAVRRGCACELILERAVPVTTSPDADDEFYGHS